MMSKVTEVQGCEGDVYQSAVRLAHHEHYDLSDKKIVVTLPGVLPSSMPGTFDCEDPFDEVDMSLLSQQRRWHAVCGEEAIILERTYYPVRELCVLCLLPTTPQRYVIMLESTFGDLSAEQVARAKAEYDRFSTIVRNSCWNVRFVSKCDIVLV